MTGETTPAAAATATKSPHLTRLRYIGWVGALCLLLASAAVGSVLFFSPYQQVQALGHSWYHDEGFYQLPLRITPGGYQLLRAGLGGAIGISLAVLLAGWWRGAAAALGTEAAWGRKRAQNWWQQQPIGWRLAGFGLVAGLVAVRTWYCCVYPLGTDEIASFDYFVHQGPLAVMSYYPIPNNHVFYNLTAVPLAALGLPVRLVMRLPTLVLGTLGTVAGYALLARVVGIRLATLLTGLVGLAPLWVYYAAVGRGYFLQFCLLQIGFLALLELLRPTSAYHRLSWLAFIGTSILGLYTIPTYIYPLLSLLVGGAFGLIYQRRWPRAAELVGAGLVIMLVTSTLYLPILCVSGWKALAGNRYVMTRTAAQFWPAFRAVLYETGADIFGPSLRLSGPLWLATAAGGWLAVWRLVPRGEGRRLALLCWVMVAMPILLMAVQRVYAPVRTILYLNYFGYLLGGVLLRQLILLWCAPARKWVPARAWWPAALALMALMGTARLWHHQTQVQAAQHETQQLEQAYGWLQTSARRHGPGTGQPVRVWLHAPLHELFFAHYSRLQPRTEVELYSGNAHGPLQPYDYIILANNFTATKQHISAAYQPVYHDSLVTIFRPIP